jgi:trimeric autotransporter adhesin
MSQQSVLRRTYPACSALVTGFVAFMMGATAAAEPTLRVPHIEGSKLQLRDSYDLSRSHLKQAANRRALSLVSGDVDGDGFPDLVSGYSTAAGGVVTLHRGNREAWAPSTPESLALVRDGSFPSGFESTSTEWLIPVAPDFMVSGDFNGDGRTDIVVARRGDRKVYLLAGQRTGFSVPAEIKLSGGVDALASGLVQSRDGVPKLVAAVSGNEGASLATFTHGVFAPATQRALPAPVDALAVGKLSADSTGDIVMLSAGRVQIVSGNDVLAASTDAAPLEVLSFGFSVRSFTLGHFIWDRSGATQIALLANDGAIHVAARADIDTRPFSVEELRLMRLEQQVGTSRSDKVGKSAAAPAWKIVPLSPNRVEPTGSGSRSKLIRARFSNQAADDILVIDALSNTVDIWVDDANGRKRASVSANQVPVAALSMQTSAFVLPSLIVLGDGAAAPSVAPSVPQAVFSVSKTTDTSDGICNADCSLREAISAANAAGGANTVNVPAGTYTLTIANMGSANEDSNARGDLDINSNLTLVGAGSASTIIQAGTSNANGIDKVIAVNPFCTTTFNASISGVTIRFGRNTQPSTAPDFSYTGGGIDICGVGAQTFTMTNVVVDQNTNTNGYGGGVNMDSVPGTNGTFSIINSTISGNRTTSTASTLKNGGGINLFGDAHNVNITNSTISGNTSAAEGGGVFVRHTNGGAITISGTTISGNTAASRGGGISNNNLLASSLTVNNDSAIVNNVSQGTAASTESRGGGISIVAGVATNTTTLTEVTISGNSANTGTFQGGGGVAAIAGTVNASFNRIAGNFAGTGGGSGFHNAGAAVTASNNWWGCNAGPGSAPCDRSANTGGTLTTTSHLTLRHGASPATIVVGQTSTLTADFLQNSTPAAVTLANLDAMIGTAVAFSTPVRGTISSAQTTIQSNGSATATFTGTSSGAGSATGFVDAQSIAAAITINPASTTTSITSDLPDPSDLNASVTVNYSVAVNAPGAGAPTGNVVVTVSGGAETCTGTVAAGNCAITLTAPGARTLTATYVGDANFIGSNGTTSHTVNALPTLSINDVSIAEGNSGTQTLTFTVTRTGATASSVTFAYATANGTATIANADYIAASGMGSIPSGGASGSTTINVTINSDTQFEGDETFFVNISSPTNATISDGQGIGTIVNDDPAPPQIPVSLQFAGTGTGSTTSATAGLSCAADCATTVASGSAITVTPVPAGGSVFMGWLGACTGLGNCATTVTNATELTATFSPSGLVATLDIDDSAPTTQYDAATDGVMVLRALFGFRRLAISTGTGTRSANDIATYLFNINPRLDVNGDGKAQPLVDGLLIVRYMLGLRDGPLVAGVPLTSLRPDAASIAAYIAGLAP